MYRNNAHIDPATGRNKRDNLRRETHGGPERKGGRIVPKGRLAHARARAQQRGRP